MSDEWIDVKKQLPPDKTWVEAIFINPGTNFSWEDEWFYWSEYWYFDKTRITHWRFITHDFFNPVCEEGYILELPIRELKNE